MATLQVLCPNGRRQNVKITPNFKLLQVLEEVCKKQGFIPAEDYKLIHGRKDLDLSLSFRYANLPNNAKLELVKMDKSRAEESVVIALQLESGQRLQHSFLPGTPLWHILTHWEAQPGEHQGKLTHIDTSQTLPLHPVCIYMVEEMIGETALQTVTLRKLGLTGGRAVIRLVHRPVEDSVIAEIMNRIEKERLKEEKLGAIAARKHAEMQSTSSENLASSSSSHIPSKMSITGTSSTKSIDTNRRSSMDTKLSQSPSSSTMSITSCPTGRKESSMDAESNMDAESKMEAETSAGRVEADGSEDMEVDRNTSSSMLAYNSAGAVSRPGRSVEGQSAIEQLRSMNIPGVDIFTPDDFNDLPPDQQQVARALAQKMMRHLMGESAQMPTNQIAARPSQAPAQPQHQFTEFKFPEATKGQNLYSNELSDVDRQEYKPCDRETVVFSLDETLGNQNQDGTATEVSDDFFEVTEADIKTMMSDLSKNVENQSEMPLMTKAMRQAKMEERYSQYKKVVIRVQFSDKLVLQGVFRPRETVFAVQKFVKEHLQDKSTPFYLYTTPPKCVLKDRSMTLIEAELVPATRVYFGSETNQDHYLSEAVRAELSPREQAERIVMASLAKSEEDVSTSSDGQMPERSRSKPRSNEGSSSGSTGGGKAPKWLKLGKK